MNPVNIGFGAFMLAWGLAMLAFPQTMNRLVPGRSARFLQEDDGTPNLTAIRIFSFFPILAGLVIAHKGLTSPLR